MQTTIADQFAAALLSHRAGFHSLQGSGLWARFRRGELADAHPDVWSAFQLRAAYLEQIGF